MRLAGHTPDPVALARCDLAPHPMPPRDGLAAVASNSFGIAVSVLAIAPTPELGRALSRSKIASALRRGGRKINVDKGPVNDFV